MATNRESQDFGFKSKDITSPLSQQSDSPPSWDSQHKQVDGLIASDVSLQVTSKPNIQNSSELDSPKSMATQSSKRFSWWQTWQAWGILLVLCSGGIGYTATSLLLRLPQTQTCSKVFWPVASAAVRLYCAKSLAEQKTVEDLLKAIALVEELPDDHPLRGDINRNVEKWAAEILEIGETKFQEGNLEAAIAIAQEIPQNAEAAKLIDSKIKQWQQIWSAAEADYDQVEKRLRASEWNEAFSWAMRLTESKNHYWSTTKYQETIDKINIAQEESATLDKAFTQLQEGSLDNLLEAIKKAKNIRQDSYAYEEAQKILSEGKEKVVKVANTYLQERNWSQLLKIAQNIPADTLGIEEQAKEWEIIGNAGTSASLGTVLNLEDAIAEAEKLPPESSFYDTAQKMIAGWKLEIEDVKHLNQAEDLARGGDVASYNAAITELGLIPKNNPRYQEAQKQINKWRGEIQIIEDRPIIARARELAYPGNPEAWRRAIAEISVIAPSSPLYQEAREYSRTWQSSIEVQEDQPILDRAISLANLEDYPSAIAKAQQIPSGRALYSEAQNKVALWRKEIRAQDYLQEAFNLANQETPDSLARAIRTIRQISSSTSVYYQVVPNVNGWSSQMVDLAQQASYTSLEEAIAIARKIPSGTTGYHTAQPLIKAWREQLNPPPLIEKKAKSVIDVNLDKPNNKNN